MSEQIRLFDADAEAARRNALEGALDAALRPAGFVAPDLAAAMRHAVFPGGQRWRPQLTLAAAELAGAAWREALPAAAAVELLHSASLVLDDLPSMDGAELRRDRPAVHVVYGAGVATVAGIGLLTTAFGLLTRSPRPRLSVALAARYIGPAEILTGQVVDLLLAAGRDPGLGSGGGAALRRVQDRKTSALIRLALYAGAVYGCTTAAQRCALGTFAARLGSAYQLMDDLLDAVEDRGGAHNAAPAAGRRAAAARVGAHVARAVDALCSAFDDSPARLRLTAFAELVHSRTSRLAGPARREPARLAQAATRPVAAASTG